MNVPECGGGVKTHRIQDSSDERPAMIWRVKSSAGDAPFCLTMSNVRLGVQPDILEHLILPSAVKFYRDTDIILSKSWNLLKNDQSLLFSPGCHRA